MDRYQKIKDVYAFLNKEMKVFEQTEALQYAVDEFVEALGIYFSAQTVQLYKREVGWYTIASTWKRVPKTDTEWIHTLLYKREFSNEEESYCCIEEAEQGYKLSVIPLFFQEHLFAVLVLTGLSEENMEALQEISDMLATWLSNRLMKRDYMNRDDRVQKLLSGLGNDYTAVYVINLDTDSFEIIINQETNNVAKVQKNNDFSTYLDQYADKYVLEESREEMKRVLRYTYLKEHFKYYSDFWFQFHTKPNDIGQTYFEAHVVRRYEDNGHFAVMGFRCVDVIVKKELEYQKELDKAYKEARQQLDIVSASIHGGIKISYDDPLYTFKYVSKQYAAMLGYDSVGELMQASKGTIVGIAHPDDVESGIAEALTQYQTSDNYAITYRMRCKDGTWKYIEDHGHKVKDADGNVEHWNLILDKNELVTKTIELESAKQAAEVKNAFLSRMSHDIRTPLNAIIGLLEQGDRHAEEVALLAENRKKARMAANYLMTLLNDMLEFNKLESENLHLVPEPFDMVQLLQDVKVLVEMRAIEEGIRLYMDDITAISYPYVTGSSKYVKQILLNVLTNAIQFNKENGSVWVSIKEKELDEKHIAFTITVKDSGIGMSSEFLEQIYEPFVQENCDSRSVYSGTGLGMSIVKKLVEQMQGTITLESQVGEGTCVKMLLPFVKAKAVQIPKQIPDVTTEYLKGMQVLLAEDNELNMEIAKCILEDEGMIVTEAHNGKEAVEIFQTKPAGTFDVILMDVMMPVMDGLTAAGQIRVSGKEDAKTIPIFAMTANAFEEDVEHVLEAGMNEHIAKPIDMKHLLSKLVQYCGPCANFNNSLEKE